jgi:hypothetical protein
MLARIRSSLTYANVMATIAVFVSLGGASYAALNLPRNSVGPKQIRPGAVGPSEVKNRSLGVKELKGSTVTALKGEKGDTGPPGPPGQDATPADFAGEPTQLVAPAGTGCTAIAQFCTGANGWSWRNFGNGYQPVGFWKDRGGVVHLEGMAELFGGSGGGQPAAFLLPPGYRPTALRRFTIGAGVTPGPNDAQVLKHVVIRPTGEVEPELGGGGFAPLDGIAFRP